MRKRIFKLILVFVMFFSIKNVYAFDVNNYASRGLCGNYEVAGFHTDGYIDKVACFNSYEEARTFMKNNGATDLAIMTRVNGQTKIIDANVALLDLSVNPETLTYFYNNSNLTGSSYTYMDTGSLYGGVDGVHLDTAYSSAKGVWAAKVQIGNYTGWIAQSTYEIVPITWIKSKSSYTVTSESIRHNYVAKIQNTYSGSAGSTIGPKPDMLSTGTYYSYDGHYFYNNLEKLIKDNKNGNHNNSVNKDNPYYNYYMYLSNHTKTNYSSTNIDEYIRNNLGYSKNVYGNKASDGTSRLHGQGAFFYYAQEKYGVNAIMALSISRNETGNGRSNLSINKNNGFGLNAVDSNPIEAANWFPTFASSILEYTSKWITYGYAHPRDWRYFGPQFGDKWIGMNVKYASDTYWSEKNASNYYMFDKAFGLQDYNYYQLGVVNGPTRAYRDASTSSQFIYEYPEREDALVIIGEENRNGVKWYKVVSDLNINSNYQEITSGDFNWNGYVYVEASNVRKINKGKNGNISPNNVYNHKDKNYTYDLYVENATFKPKVAITTKNTNYYYEPTLTTYTGSTALKDRYVMVYAAAYNNGTPVAYLITSDYFKDQREWVVADSIKFTSNSYGKVSVTVSGNQYTWVNYNTEDASYSLISGLYTNSYVPVLDQIQVGSNLWYKVPVSLTSNSNIYGYTLASAPGVSISLSKAIVTNNNPVISASDKTIIEGDSFDPKAGVTATDPEDGNITSKITIVENTVNTKTPGTYKVVYKVVDNSNASTTKTITVTVKANNAPVINASDRTVSQGNTFDPKESVTASDTEDGDITKNIKVVENTVDTSKLGTYKVIYEVVDSKNKKTTKEIKVEVVEPLDVDNMELDELLEKQKEGEFYLEDLKYNQTNKEFTISGYLIILNQNNINKEYALVLINKDNDEVYMIDIDSWIKNTPYDLGSENGKTYTDSWFKGKIDLSDVPNGDYDIYMLGATDDSFAMKKVNNYFNKNISRRGEFNNHGYNFKVQQKLKSKQVELSVRDELYTTSEAPTTRNMTNGYDEIKFVNDKLYIYGYSFDYDGIYNDSSKIERKVILENTSNYKQTVFDVGSTKGPFEIDSLDKKDKTYAWYEKELDLSKLDKGTYSILVYTKTSNAANYDELLDMFRSLKETTTINDKKYTITYNKNRGNRVELVVE